MDLKTQDQRKKTDGKVYVLNDYIYMKFQNNQG